MKLLDPECKVEEFLHKTLDPPRAETIRNAVSVLQDIGALSLDEKLTDLGEKLGTLPVHPLTSRMLFFAILMNCLDPALTLACASDYKDPFALPMLPDERTRAAAAKFELASLYGGLSDQLAVIAAFDCWKAAKERGEERGFCSRYFVSSSTMHMLSGMRGQLQKELSRHGFIPEDVSRCSLNARNPGILRAVLVAGLYPMVGRLLPPLKNGKRTFVETASGGKVQLHVHSINTKLSYKANPGERPLIVYDEVTRGDGGMNIRNCTVVAPLPLLLLSSEIAVAPADDDDDDNDEGSDVDYIEDGSDEDVMEIDRKSGGQHEEKIMSSPDKSVKVIVDCWLHFGSKALDVAQVYCLRERLSTAILFKVQQSYSKYFVILLQLTLHRNLQYLTIIHLYPETLLISNLSFCSLCCRLRIQGKICLLLSGPLSMLSHVLYLMMVYLVSHFRRNLWSHRLLCWRVKRTCNFLSGVTHMTNTSSNHTLNQHVTQAINFLTLSDHVRGMEHHL